MINSFPNPDYVMENRALSICISVCMCQYLYLHSQLYLVETNFVVVHSKVPSSAC